MNRFPRWVEEAAELPLAFAQVREDPLLDEWVAARLPPGFTMAMVASGGCTAAWLAARTKAAAIHLVDPNEAQIRLAILKLSLLEEAAPEEREQLLGHAPMAAGERAERIAGRLEKLGFPSGALGPAGLLGERGPDHAGRYEALFDRLHADISAEGMEPHVEALCRSNDPAEASRLAHPATQLGQAIDAAFDRTMALPILIHLFGEGATRNRVEPFAAHFARRTRHALAAFPASENPFLSQVLLGRYPAGHPAPWLAAPCHGLPRITWEKDTMQGALAARKGELDLVHLSNILDWLSEEAAAETLAAAWSALREGGLVMIRQLNSSLDIRKLPSGFDWDADASGQLLAKDRSFFYRAIHLGRKA